MSFWETAHSLISKRAKNMTNCRKKVRKPLLENAPENMNGDFRPLWCLYPMRRILSKRGSQKRWLAPPRQSLWHAAPFKKGPLSHGIFVLNYSWKVKNLIPPAHYKTIRKSNGNHPSCRRTKRVRLRNCPPPLFPEGNIMKRSQMSQRRARYSTQRLDHFKWAKIIRRSILPN